VFGDRSLSYAELDARANRLAHRLCRLGVGPEVLVGICVERGLEMVVGLLAILKAGGAYVPIDPDYPAERIRFMLEDSSAPVLLTQSSLLVRLPDRPGCRTLCLDTDGATTAGDSSGPTGPGGHPEHLAYVIYTSGSTGRPKGVMIEHRSVVNLISWHRRAYDVGPEDRATQIAALGFDAVVWELWPYLAPERLWAWLGAQRITISFLPTPLVEEVMAAASPPGPALRRLLTGGDRLRRRPAASQGLQLVNHYGPTECTVVATAGPVWPGHDGDDDGPPPIGRPIANTRAHVLDEHLAPVPVGMPGELCIGGVGVARGYLNRPELTTERFIPDPFTDGPGGRR
jgi:amino acid adenylation domain-containing protein